MLDLGSTFLQSVERSPRAIAIIDGTLRLGYAEWYERISGVVAGLGALGIGRNDHVVAVLPNGWLLASEVVGPGVGGDLFRYVVSHDDGQTWKHQVEFLKPGRPIGGRACPRALLVDPQTVGIVYYDVDAKQPGGPGVFFLRLPLAKFAPLP